MRHSKRSRSIRQTDGIADDSTAARRFAWRRAGLLVALLAVAAHFNIFSNAPVFDDSWVIFNNPLIKNLGNIPRIFKSPYNAAISPDAGVGAGGSAYRPVTTVSYALNYALGGDRVVGYHIVNLGLHLACCLLLLVLVRHLARSALTEADSVGGPPPENLRTQAAARSRWGRPESIALIAALFFAVHPAHVEAVTGMVGRAELLAALGTLGCLYLVCTRQRGVWRLPAGLVALLLAVLAKENAAVTPVLFAIIAFTLPAAAGFPARDEGAPTESSRPGWLRCLGICAMMALPTGVYFLLKARVPGELLPSGGADWFGGHARAEAIFTMNRVLAEYFRILIWPHPLGLDIYYWNKIGFVADFGWRGALIAMVWLAPLIAGFGLRRRAPVAAAGLLWIFAALLPVSHLLPSGALMAERLLYLPSAGYCLVLAWGMMEIVSWLDRRWPGMQPKRLVFGLAALALAAGLARTLARNRDWRDGLAMWVSEVRKSPDNAVANNLLAREYMERGDFSKAKDRLEIALKTDPDYWAAEVNLGVIAHHDKDDAAALRHLARATAISPAAASPKFFTGMVRFERGEPEAALENFKAAAAAAPLEALNHFWVGRLEYLLDARGPAKKDLNRAIALDPALRIPHGYLAAIAQRENDTPEMERALRRFGQPLAPLHLQNGEIISAAGRPADALSHFRLALESDPKNPRALFAAGRELARIGDFDGAVENYRNAISLNPRDQEARSALDVLAIDMAASPDLFQGMSAYNRGDLKAALASFQRATAASPQEARAYAWLGRTLYLLNRLKESRQALLRAVALNPDARTPHGYLAAIAQREQDPPAVAREEKIYPWPLEGLHFQNGRLLAAARHPDAAILHYRLALALNPRHADALFEIGSELEKKGDLSGARNSYEQALAMAPEMAAARAALGRLGPPPKP